MRVDNAIVEKRVNDFIKRSKELGIKITPQRVAIYRELANTDEHPSAEAIYRKIKNYYPNISLTTIYRTLETFEKLGLVSVVNILYNAARYDANLEPHHHMVCVECKKVEDFYDESLSKLDFSQKTLSRYKVLGYTVQLNGICKDCQSKS